MNIVEKVSQEQVVPELKKLSFWKTLEVGMFDPRNGVWGPVQVFGLLLTLVLGTLADMVYALDPHQPRAGGSAIFWSSMFVLWVATTWWSGRCLRSSDAKHIRSIHKGRAAE